jgi:hypothetical protein
MPSFLIIGFLLLFYLPEEFQPLALLTGLVFWLVYYARNNFSKNKDE